MTSDWVSVPGVAALGAWASEPGDPPLGVWDSEPGEPVLGVWDSELGEPVLGAGMGPVWALAGKASIAPRAARHSKRQCLRKADRCMGTNPRVRPNAVKSRPRSGTHKSGNSPSKDGRFLACELRPIAPPTSGPNILQIFGVRAD